MPTNHFFAMFKPTQWLVRVELRIEAPASSEVSWQKCYQISLDTWKEALEEVIKLSDHWDLEVRDYFPDLYIRFNRTGPGAWVIEAFDAELLCPKQVRIECEVYVAGVIGDEEKWFVATYHFVNELLCFQPDLDSEPEDSEPDPLQVDPNPEPDDNWFNEEASAQPDPEPEPQYEPETIIIPIPSWDWVETEPEPDYAVARDFVHYDLLNRTEPEPEPEQPQPQVEPDNRYWRNEPTLKHVEAVTIGVLTVTVKTPDKLCRGYKTFDLSPDYEIALKESRLRSDLIINQIVDAYCPYDNESYERDFRSNCIKLEWTPVQHYDAIEWVTIQWQFFPQELPLECQSENDEWQKERSLWIGTQTVEFGSVDGINRIGEVWYCKEYAVEWIRGASRSFALTNDLGDRALVGTESLETFWNDDPIQVWARNHWDHPRPTWTAKAVKLV